MKTDKKQWTKLMAAICLTDAHLCMHKGCINASFTLTLSSKNTDLVLFYEALLIDAGIGCRTKTSFNKHTGAEYFSVISKVHPKLTILWERIYQDERKVPSPHDFKLLDWEFMAIMYMADGNIQKAGKRWYPLLNLCKWSYAELCWVKQQVKTHLNIDMNIYKCGKYFRLGVSSKDVNIFFTNVTPFITESFQHKLPYGKPSLEVMI
jgi:hypothetical protein